MKASEAKELATKAKELKLINRRTDILQRIEAQAKFGNDNLVLGEWLDEADVDFFENLGYVVLDHSRPTVTFTNGGIIGSGGSGTVAINNTSHTTYFKYSEISWV